MNRCQVHLEIRRPQNSLHSVLLRMEGPSLLALQGAGRDVRYREPGVTISRASGISLGKSEELRAINLSLHAQESIENPTSTNTQRYNETLSLEQVTACRDNKHLRLERRQGSQQTRSTAGTLRRPTKRAARERLSICGGCRALWEVIRRLGCLRLCCP